ncbi:RNA polymerase sigma-70 factor (ECF subfamily) [Rhizobium sp. PP-F2F-G48]|uniref:RNA polymerase sigma factor n=1 Tax=Rhizobium sp. PP-F2F-G48 TaxID=2135651 RepID=UPI00104EE287|nr:sigma factor [Rhizobium sp. PP-F2F-G48]TCM58445.1 RNA polymerase sigma-70 factor (ECF subfamily) [Rhizobium sp. PP-F2F-G48]
MRPAQESIDISRDLVSLLPRLRRFALTLTRDGLQADDLVQAVCERATGRQPVWNGHGRLEDALYILARTLQDEANGRKRVAADPRVGSASAGGATSGDALQQMMIAMPEGLASAFLLVAVEQRNYRDAGHILGLAPDVVAHKLATARLRLAAMASDTTERRA